MLLCVWCTGPKKFLLEISLFVYVMYCLYWPKIFCWKFLFVYVMNWPYKSFRLKCFSVCVCVCVCVCCTGTGPIKVYVGNVSLCVMYWPYKSFCWKCFCVCAMYWPYETFCLEMLLCVWCTGPKNFLLEISVCVCVMYWPCKSLFWKCFCVCVMYWPYKSSCWKCFCVCDVLVL